MAWNDNLDGVHLEIAAEHRSPLHVLAGPGTGKTLAMMRRIARLLEEGGDPRRILAVSFTRTAARDLREQLVRLEAPRAAEVNATTLHSLCFTALLAEGVFEGTGRRARPLLSYEIDHLVNDLYAHFGGKRAVKELLEAYEAAWARLQHDAPGAPLDERDVQFERALLDWLTYHRSILIGELVPIVLRFLQQNPMVAVLPAYQAVLVDEYQDLNKADQALIDVLAANGSLTVVGDDNQSIYRFRYANPEGIRVFRDRYPAAVSRAIQECRRCPPNIVAMSNSLLASDPQARQAPLTPRVGPNASVFVVQHESIEDEADALGAFIDHYLRYRPALPPGQVLVLSPRRVFGNAVRDALIRRRRNSMSFFWEDALEADAAAGGFCLLTLLIDRADRAAYRAWLGFGHPDGNRVGYARVRRHAEANGLEPFDVCELVSRGEVELRYAERVVERHRDLLRSLERLDGLQGMDLVDALWAGDNPDTLTIRLLAQTIAREVPEPLEIRTRLVEAITQPELPDSGGDVIRVMSLHKSKGLTADLVVVAGCVDGAIPTVNPRGSVVEQDASLREQRRLFYVAVTRARDTLVLSSLTRMPLGDALRANIPAERVYRRGKELFARLNASRFIGELGPAAPRPISGPDWRAQLAF